MGIKAVQSKQQVFNVKNARNAVIAMTAKNVVNVPVEQQHLIKKRETATQKVVTSKSIGKDEQYLDGHINEATCAIMNFKGGNMKLQIQKFFSFLTCFLFIMTVSAACSSQGIDRSVAGANCDEVYFVDNENFFENYEQCREKK